MRGLQFLTGAWLALMGFGGVACAQAHLDFTDEATRGSYSLGYQIGGDFKRQGIEMREAAVARGMEDALTGAEPWMSEEAMDETLVALKREVVADARRDGQERGAKMRRAGLAFLEQNADKPGVTTRASGLQYKVIEEGSGESPGPEDTVRVHYRGTLITGQPFASSYARGQPATFRVDRLIDGWSEGLQLMREGAKYHLFIPPDLAYDDRGPLADQTLIVEVELLAVNPGAAQAADADPK
jgi:FKBP-type peptidyl-prolyl cis-trans isomerase FklB